MPTWADALFSAPPKKARKRQNRLSTSDDSGRCKVCLERGLRRVGNRMMAFDGFSFSPHVCAPRPPTGKFEEFDRALYNSIARGVHRRRDLAQSIELRRLMDAMSSKQAEYTQIVKRRLRILRAAGRIRFDDGLWLVAGVAAPSDFPYLGRRKPIEETGLFLTKW